MASIGAKLALLVVLAAALLANLERWPFARPPKPPSMSYDEKVKRLMDSGAARGFASMTKPTLGNRFEYDCTMDRYGPCKTL